ncbi:ABC transporter ATP-binding protein [Ruegeria sp. EL01]|uniref:ABC transporter ATP-binding protein n=1 Tax=Ruegeria sp. EL01 TaxID=2107578 RepID=UPI000EA7F8D0|nr:ABC transporter ATP-binding protein [Ruegeria sp. EL01]
MTDAAISIKGLRKTYRGGKGQPEKLALKGIELNVPRGSVFGLLGPNGAGKSTLINILAGLVVKSAGHVSIWGFDQDQNPRQSRAAIGVMPQELNLDPFFTPRGALEVQAGLYGVPKSERRSDEILELVGLSDKAEAYARTLSGGMRRRLLLAKALVHHPKILVLDEPTAGVDIELRQMLWANVRKLNEQGMTIILTTHYLEEAQEMCDEIAIINHGEKVTQDSTANLLGRMDSRTMVIVPDSPVSDLPVAEGVDATLRDDGSLVLQYRSNHTSAEQVLEAVRSADIRIRDVRTEEADLEDVFLALTSSRADDPPADDQDQPRRGIHRVKL